VELPVPGKEILRSLLGLYIKHSPETGDATFDIKSSLLGNIHLALKYFRVAVYYHPQI
jgi:hypothetical protein